MQERIIESRHLLDEHWILGQGTIYPDTIESGGTAKAALIKTHHNRVAGIQKLIEAGRIVEPLKSFYKDEVREVGRELGLPAELLDRHPFPGPGLAIRCLCSEFDAPVRRTDGRLHRAGALGGRAGRLAQLRARCWPSTRCDHARATELINRLAGVNRVIAPVETERAARSSMQVRACSLTPERLARLRARRRHRAPPVARERLRPRGLAVPGDPDPAGHGRLARIPWCCGRWIRWTA